jgi:enoyl-[acyl-carrier-protein] reductase (NADH)
MKQFHRVAFGLITYQMLAKEYAETQQVLPEDGVMFVPAGRKAALPNTRTLALNNEAKKRVNVAIDLVKTAEEEITKYRKMKELSKAKAPCRETVLKHASMAPGNARQGRRKG